MATTWSQLGALAQHRGNYDEAARQYHASFAGPRRPATWLQLRTDQCPVLDQLVFIDRTRHVASGSPTRGHPPGAAQPQRTRINTGRTRPDTNQKPGKIPAIRQGRHRAGLTGSHVPGDSSLTETPMRGSNKSAIWVGAAMVTFGKLGALQSRQATCTNPKAARPRAQTR